MSEWYCIKCAMTVRPSAVLYDETHEDCGCPVKPMDQILTEIGATDIFDKAVSVLESGQGITFEGNACRSIPSDDVDSVVDEIKAFLKT